MNPDPDGPMDLGSGQDEKPAPPTAQFVLTDQQKDLKSMVRGFLAEHASVAVTRQWMENDKSYDHKVWTAMATGLGLQGLLVPQAYGGAGLSMVELSIVLEEMGRVLYSGPYFSTIGMALNAFLLIGNPAIWERYLPRIAAQALTATVAWRESSLDWTGEQIRTRATHSGTGWTLDGAKTLVVDGHSAQLILVLARTGDDMGLFAVEGNAPGLTRTPLATLDPTRRQAELKFSATPAVFVGGTEAFLSDFLDRAQVALAGEQVGGAARCLEMSVDYALARVQFGRPIGSFQAIKHKCARMLMRLELASTVAKNAAWAMAAEPLSVPRAATVAQLACSEAYFAIASDNIQIHGGIGFTWEHDAHLYYKRALSSGLLFGDGRHQRRLLASRLGI